MNIRYAFLAAALATCSAAAFAEDNDTNYPFDPRWAAQEQAREARINEDRAQRYNGDRGADLNYAPGPWRDAPSRRGDAYRGATGNDECWNPHARHFEAVRPGDRQDDLDFSRCRPRSWR